MTNNNFRLLAIALITLVLAACGGEPAATERTEGGPTPVSDAATQVGLSTGGQAGIILNAPGNYVRGVAGNIDKAKAAAALAGKTAADRVDMAPSRDTGN